MSATNERQKVLVTGAVGGLAQAVVQQLESDWDLVGVDPRPRTLGTRFPGEFIQVNYLQRKMADVFRSGHFDALIHLGRVWVTASTRSQARYHLNVLGTRNLLQLALQYGVKKVIVVSTFHVYGAHPHNPMDLTEEDALRASQTFAELSDAVELDHISTMFMLKYPEITTTVLRPANIIGPRIQNQISRLLRAKVCPTLMGFDPVMQFIHEKDLAAAIQLLLTKGTHSRVYNVAGEGVIPWSQAIHRAGSRPFPIPSSIARPFFAGASQVGVNFPKHLVDFFKYPTLMSDRAMRTELGYVPAMSTAEALAQLRS